MFFLSLTMLALAGNMPSSFSSDYLQYGALGVVFFQTILFLVLGKTILSGAAANRRAYEQLTEQSLHHYNASLRELVAIIVSNTEAMASVVQSQKEFQLFFIDSIKALDLDHRELHTAFLSLMIKNNPLT